MGPGHRGLFTAKTTFVPLAQAQDTGDSVQVPYDKQQVIDAPTMEADGPVPGRGGRAVPPLRPVTASTAPTAACPARDDRDTVGRDTSGPTTDDAMTRSEEELRVGTQTRGAAGPVAST